MIIFSESNPHFDLVCVYLKLGVTAEILEKQSIAMTDNESAELLVKERSKLFKLIFEQKCKRA